MKIRRKFMGILLTMTIIASGLGMNGSVAQAKDLGDPDEYCPIEIVAQLVFSIHRETEEVSMMISNKVIGCHDAKSPWAGTEKTKYWLSEKEIDDFWNAMCKYMFSDNPSDERWEHNWTHAGLFNSEAEGSSNWTTIDEIRYLTSVKRSEIEEAINAMSTVLTPFKSILQAEKNIEKDSGESKSSHTHNFVETTVAEATADTDSIVTLECSICGQQQTYVTVQGTAVNQFVKNTIDKLQKAPVNGSITIDTDIWTCFNRAVIEELKNRQDISVTVNFTYKSTGYTFTIPAGYGADNLNALLDENGYCGFMYLLSVFGGQER